MCFIGITLSFVAFLAIYDAILRRITPSTEESPGQTPSADGLGEGDNNPQDEMSISLLLIYYCKHFSFVVLQGNRNKC